VSIIRANSPYSQYSGYGNQGFGGQDPLASLRALLGPGGGLGFQDPNFNALQGFLSGLLQELVGPQLSGMGDQSSFSMGPAQSQFGSGPLPGSGLSFGAGPQAGGYGGTYGAGPAAGAYGSGAYGGNAYGGGMGLPPPADPNEFASYLAGATNANGEQNGNVQQSRALPGTRFATVQDGQQFDAAVARNYAYQFAASANGFNARDAQGLAAGAQSFYNMSPDAQAFMQVASVYKGDLAGGAQNYDNGKLQQMLRQSGFPGANGAGVGDTDVETLGAVASAIDQGYVTLDDVMNSGAIRNRGAYQQAIDFVQNGELANTLNAYDGSVPGSPYGGTGYGQTPGVGYGGAGGPGGAHGCGPGGAGAMGQAGNLSPFGQELGNLLNGLFNQMGAMGAGNTPAGAELMALVQQLLNALGMQPGGAGGPAPIGAGPGNGGAAGNQGVPGGALPPPVGAPGNGGAAGNQGVPTPGYGGGVQPPGYGAPPGGGVQPPGYGTPPGGGVQPPGHGTPPGGGVQPPGYGTPPGGGVQPPGYGTPPGEGVEPGLGPIPDVDYRDLNLEQRRELSGLSDRERAILHLWGIQMASEGSNDGGVLLNVENNPNGFTEAEQQLAQELLAQERAANGGQVSGQSLDQEFFELYEKISGVDVSDRYANAPIRFADGPVDMENRLTGDNGLNSFENQVLQLWGHSPLFNDGVIDGNIMQYALDNPDSRLEVGLRDEDLQGLLEADRTDDGVVNGTSLENAFIDTLDRLYYDGAPEASLGRTMNDAMEEAAARRAGADFPPPREGLGEITGVPEGHGNSGNIGNCPFFGGGGQNQMPPPVQATPGDQVYV
jgi:hypothetical protein